jgi:hypothetical protein
MPNVPVAGGLPDKLCKVVLTFEGQEGSIVTEVFVSVPALASDYHNAARLRLDWLPMVVDPDVEFSVEVCPPFSL